MLLELRQLSIPPGQRVLLHDVSWQEFDLILDELGEHRSTRVTYDNGILEIMTPLPEHEDDKGIISDLIKVLLEELDIEFRSLGSTTYKKQSMLKGIEPDQYFYIQNEPAIRGKKRLDLTVDPPPFGFAVAHGGNPQDRAVSPDLALEIDITSRTHPNIYQALGVPELWRFEQSNLQINVLQNGEYVETETSALFPNLPLKEVIPRYLEQSKTMGRNAVMKAFRQWLKAFY